VDRNSIMQPKTRIDLVGEILPVALLKCKSALDAMAARETLCIQTDDPIVVENMTKFIQCGEYIIERQDKIGKCHKLYVLKS